MSNSNWLMIIIFLWYSNEIWTKYFTFSCQFYHHLLILLRYLLIFHYFMGGFLSFQNYLFPQFFFLFHYLYIFLNPMNLANYFLFHPLFIYLWNLLKFRFFLFRMYLYFNIRVHLILIDWVMIIIFWWFIHFFMNFDYVLIIIFVQKIYFFLLIFHIVVKYFYAFYHIETMMMSP